MLLFLVIRLKERVLDIKDCESNHKIWQYGRFIYKCEVKAWYIGKVPTGVYILGHSRNYCHRLKDQADYLHTSGPGWHLIPHELSELAHGWKVPIVSITTKTSG